MLSIKFSELLSYLGGPGSFLDCQELIAVEEIPGANECSWRGSQLMFQV